MIAGRYRRSLKAQACDPSSFTNTNCLKLAFDGACQATCDLVSSEEMAKIGCY